MNRRHLVVGVLLAVVGCAAGSGHRPSHRESQGSARLEQQVGPMRGTTPREVAKAGNGDLDGAVAPVARRLVKKLEIHGELREDAYFWLRERDNPEVIRYLEAENAYTEASMGGTEALQEELFEEMKARLREDDESVPYHWNGYLYYFRYPEAGEYKIHCRKQGSLEAAEEIVLDVNGLAEDHEHVRVNRVHPSDNNRVLAYAIDTVGRRFYSLRFRNLETGEPLADVIEKVTGNYAWANDNKTVFYTKQHPETLRWYRIYKHVLGTDPGEDELVYEEKDEEFNCQVWKTKSRRFIMIESEQTLSTEYRYLDANAPEGEFQVFLEREENHEYEIDDLGEDFLIRTNWNASNFRLMRASPGASAKEEWVEVIPHRDDVFVADVEVFQDFLVIAERHEGLIHMRIISGEDQQEHYLRFGEPAYDAYFTDNETFDSHILRFVYTSLTTPKSVFDYDMRRREKKLRKEDPVLGGFDKADYVTERLWATARDGTRVPISIVYRKGFVRDGSRPLLLYGYGSYGSSVDAAFRPRRVSLLDRGFAFAIAHVRGGQELGREWYESGKLFSKKNTFTDFIDCARYLIAEKYTSAERLFAMGGSAGGLLMGAVANMAPELFRGIVNHVPFVDVVTTMLDSDIPLTTSEYDEWGNPNQKAYYEYMLSYSPYDQLGAKDYPSMLVTTGLHDSQVQYWEPAKYVAKLRALKTDDNLVMLKTNMEAGHSGASGRFKPYRERALDYAFLLRLAGLDQ